MGGARPTGDIANQAPPRVFAEALLLNHELCCLPTTFVGTLTERMIPSIASEVPAADKADCANPDHVAAPSAGMVTVNVSAGDTVEAGATVGTIEAMKMEAAITAPKSGTVDRVAATAQVEGGDLLVVVIP